MSLWGEALQTTLECEQHAPQRHYEVKVRSQEVGLG
jgi:hypothetical protein